MSDGRTDHEVIAMEHSFHGRTYGALSVTGNPHYREAFGTMPCGARFAKFNDFASVEALADDKTCAVILEPVQGEGGLQPATESFLRDVRNFCDERGILLIFDEVQCGMGRCGSMFRWQKYGIKPDIMTSAKALGCGVPVGAFLLTEEVAQHSLVPGDHGTTYGGNPLACAAVCKVLELYGKDHIIDHVNEIAPYLEERLDRLASRYACILERRGCGLMQGLVFDRPVAPVINILRFVPPLIITKENVDEMISILEPVIAALL